MAIDRAATVGPLFISAISIVELTYLTEKKRVPSHVLQILLQGIDQPIAMFRVISVSDAVSRALSRVPRAEVPEMPDRIIAATGLETGMPVITKDPELLSCNAVTTIW